MSEKDIFLGLGSNMGDRLQNLTQAINAISKLPDCWLIRYSSIYETEPVGLQEQHDFLNMVAQLETDLSPEALLEQIQTIEEKLGRLKGEKWGPRIIDVDILYWNRKQLSSQGLTLPHPECEKRRFVLEPLNEIAADFEAPPRFVAVNTLLENVPDNSSVELRVHRYDLNLN